MHIMLPHHLSLLFLLLITLLDIGHTDGAQCACKKFSIDDLPTEKMNSGTEVIIVRGAPLPKLGDNYFHAHSPSLGKCVLVKEVTGRDNMQYAKREMNQLKSFKGAKFINRILDSKEEGEKVQMVLELSEETLADMLKKIGGHTKLRNQPQNVLRAMKSVALALQEAQKSGVYLNVRPDNFLMFKEGDGKTLPVPKLNNFWTFKGFEGDGSIYIRKTAVDPNFISPEMTVPRKLDASERPFLVSKKADIWSFGVMFYEIIYGSEAANKVRASLRALLQEKVKSTKEELTKKSGEIVATIDFGRRAKEGGTQWKAIVDMLKSCIQVIPAERPTFDQLLTQIDVALASKKDGSGASGSGSGSKDGGKDIKKIPEPSAKSGKGGPAGPVPAPKSKKDGR